MLVCTAQLAVSEMVLTQRSNARRPTLEDVARWSGVSKSTVSRVVNGESKVSAEAAVRVREAISALGYVPNQAARQLVTRHTGAVAVVASQPENRLFLDPYFDCLLRGIRGELARHGAQAVLLFLDEPDDLARVADYLGGGHVDGAILFSLRPGDRLPEMVDRLGLPAVFGGRPSCATATPRAARPTSTATTAAAPARPSGTWSTSAASASPPSPAPTTRRTPPRTGSPATGTSSWTPRPTWSSGPTTPGRAAPTP